VSAEPQLVRRFVEELLGKPQLERVAKKPEKSETASALQVIRGG
jgi:hypothetical protein